MRFTKYRIKKVISDFLNTHILHPFGFCLCNDCHTLIYDDVHRCIDCQYELDEYRREEARQEYYEDMISEAESRYDLD